MLSAWYQGDHRGGAGENELAKLRVDFRNLTRAHSIKQSRLASGLCKKDTRTWCETAPRFEEPFLRR